MKRRWEEKKRGKFKKVISNEKVIALDMKQDKYIWRITG